MKKDANAVFRESYGRFYNWPPGWSLDRVLSAGDGDARRRNCRFIVNAGQDGDHENLLERTEDGSCFLSRFDGFTIIFTYENVSDDRRIVVEVIEIIE